MASTENTGDAAARENRRAAPRYGVDGEATLRLLKQGTNLACRIADFSLNGCLLRTQERFRGASGLPVEVAFRIRGLSFRFSGVIQRTDGQHQIGIRFVDVPERRKVDLLEALAEAEEEMAAKAEKQAAPAPSDPQAARPTTVSIPVPKPAPPAASTSVPVLPLVKAATPASAAPAPARGKHERREQSREKVDTSAVIHLINIASRLPGRILDLSTGGCRIRTLDRFPVGIYTRVEVEFLLEGLPFRLGGVTQAIIDRHTVGIRFLDMSERKREQVEQLIEEIREETEKGTDTP